MEAYIYQADIYCCDCGRAIRKRLRKEGKAPENWRDETSYDSDEFPKGPYADGGGESDSPSHCASGPYCLCAEEIEGELYGCFLANDLTSDGVEYVKELAKDDPDSALVRFWVDYYSRCGYEI